MKKYGILFLLVVLSMSASAAVFTVNGISYVTLSSSEVSVTANGYSGSVSIPAKVSYNGVTYTVTAISSSAFNNCSNLTSVSIGSNVATIESGAFAYSKSLSSVSIPNSVKKIGNQAFANCKALTKITLPSSLTSLGGQAFLDCTGLTSVILPSTLTSIEFGTFSGCTSLSSVSIPSSVTSIGQSAFQGCTALTSITIPTSIKTIDKWAFLDCSKLKTVYYLSESPVSINSQAFSSSTYSSATLNVAYGKKSQVSGLTGWGSFSTIKETTKTLNVGDEFVVDGIRYRVVNSRSVGVIASSSKYTGKITIPSSVQYGGNTLSVVSIVDYAFYGSSNLTSITIPNSVTSIGDRAFYGCNSIDALTIPSAVTGIGNEVFAFCSGLRSIVVDKSNSKYDSRDNCNCIIVKSTNTLIQGCKASVIPSSVTSIGDAAFYGHTGLTAITIPSSVKSIGWASFATCTNLTSIIIPSSVTSIGRECFAFCEKLNSITVDSKNSKYDSRGNCNAIVETATNTLVQGCKTSTIPASVRAIGDYAFRGMSGLTSINIPYTVKSIGDYAFSMCDGLTKVRYLTTAPFSVSANCFSGSSDSSAPYNVTTLVVRRGYSYGINFVAGWKNFKTIVEDDTVFEDVNGDGEVNTADIVSIYNYILSADASGLAKHTADVNWDESVNTGDVVHIYNYIINVGGVPSPVKTKTFSVNGVSFKMVEVEGGTFQMGGTMFDWEKPVHSVTLSSYYIGQTEVTQALWTAVTGSNPSYFKGDNLPVEDVSWNDCQTFIQKLNQLTGETFRLPTEAEWEFAAKGGNKSRGYTYSGSNTKGNVAWYTSNSYSKTHSVGTKNPNELGIYDMSGNVWEWCQDWYGSYSSDAQSNPTGPSSGSYRVYRGGGWNSFATYCRTAYRGGDTPTTAGYDLGLRLAR